MTPYQFKTGDRIIAICDSIPPGGLLENRARETIANGTIAEVLSKRGSSYFFNPYILLISPMGNELWYYQKDFKLIDCYTHNIKILREIL